MAEFEVFPPAEWSESSEGSNQGQREEIERLVGEAYAKLRLKKRGEFNRKVSELSLYPRGLVGDVIREKMGKVQQPAAMRLASIHEAVTAFPKTQQYVASRSSDKGASPQEFQEIRIPELEKPENARWLALLIDTEGALGWRRYARGKNRIDERWKYWYRYRAPYVSLGMLEAQSKATVDEGARLVGWKPRTTTVLTARIRRFDLLHGRALSVMRYMNPYQVKFARLTKLCLILFKHHTIIPRERFDKVIETLFDTYVTPKETNTILLQMSQPRFQQLLKQAEQLADTYLKRPWRPLASATPKGG